jgi:hypothetical protein
LVRSAFFFDTLFREIPPLKLGYVALGGPGKEELVNR